MKIPPRPPLEKGGWGDLEIYSQSKFYRLSQGGANFTCQPPLKNG